MDNLNKPSKLQITERHDGGVSVVTLSGELTLDDGDLAFACATGAVDAHFDRLRMMVTDVTAEAVRDAVAYHRETS